MKKLALMLLGFILFSSLAYADRMSNLIVDNLSKQNCIFSELQLTGGSASQTFTDQNTYYQLTQFTANGPENGVTADHTNDHITILHTGYYMITGSLSFSGSNTSTYEVQIEVNNGATSKTNVRGNRVIGTGSDVGSMSLSGIVSLTAGDTLELWGRCTSSANKDFDMTEGTISIVYIGN